MEGVRTGSSETKHLPCDSDQLTAEILALERAAFHEANKSTSRQPDLSDRFLFWCLEALSLLNLA